MKNWPKLLVGIVVASMLVAFAGCSKEAATQSKWEKIQNASIITVGNSPGYPPFESIDDDGNRVGFDIDLMDALADELGVKVEYKTMEFGTIVDAVKAGQVDIGVSGFSVTPERKEKIDFTNPYFAGGQVVMANPDSGIEKIEDLSGEIVAVHMGTTCEKAALTIEGAEVKSFDDFNTAIMLLKSNGAKAVIADISVAEEYVEKEGFVIIGEPLTHDECAIIVQKGNEDLVQALNDALAKVKENGVLDQLKAKWELQ